MRTEQKNLFWAALVIVVVFINVFVGLHGPQGSDSYAFLAYACHPELGIKLADLNTNWAWWPCDIRPILVANSVAALTIAISASFILWRRLKIDVSLLPLLFFGATPLLFAEVLRYENDLMGFALSFASIALIEWALWRQKKLFLGPALLGIVASYFFWEAAPVLLLVPLFLRYDKTKRLHKIGALICFAALGWTFRAAFLELLAPGRLAAEMTPLLGLVFLVPFLLFWKHEPKEIKVTATIFLILATIQMKYAYLAVFWCAPALLFWLKTQPARDKKALLTLLFGLLLVWGLMFFAYWPTFEDHALVKQGIQLSRNESVPLLVSWNDKWLVKSKGFQLTQKKDDVDWNAPRPFIAISRADENADCTLLARTPSAILWNCPAARPRND